VVRIEGRPVIVLSDNHKSTAWIAFLLAHEIGHIGQGKARQIDPGALVLISSTLSIIIGQSKHGRDLS
jgi:hypothetical protein